MNAVYPLLLLKLRTQDSGRRTYEMKTLLKKSFTVLSLTSVVFSLALWYAAPLLLLSVRNLRRAFPSSGCCRSGCRSFLSSLMMWTLIALGKQMVLAVIYGSLMMVTVLLDILVIPTYGAIGAAWITVGSEGLVLIFSDSSFNVIYEQTGIIRPIRPINQSDLINNTMNK